MGHDDINKRTSAPLDRGDQLNPTQQGDGGNIASFLQNLTSKDYQEAMIAQNPTENVSRGLGQNEQAYCDSNYNGQHLVVRFTPGFDPRKHKNEDNAQSIVYLEPVKGANNYYNCLVNCHYDKQGNLVGTPAHAQRNPYTGKIECYVPPNTPEVKFKNHFPEDNKKKHGNDRSVTT